MGQVDWPYPLEEGAPCHGEYRVDRHGQGHRTGSRLFIKDAIAVAVMNSAGKVVMESILETKAATIVQFIRGLHRNLLVTF